VYKDKVTDIIKNVGKYKLENYDEVDLIEEDILDSFGIIGLITQINKEFNLDIEITEAPVSTWRKIDNISKYIEDLLIK